MKYCTGCKQEKELSQYNKNQKRADGLQRKCRECTRIPSAPKTSHSYRDYIEKAGLGDYYKTYIKVN